MTIEVYIDEKLAFRYETDFPPRVGELLSVNSYIDRDYYREGGMVESIFVVKNVIHNIYGYNAEYVNYQIHVEEATEWPTKEK